MLFAFLRLSLLPLSCLFVLVLSGCASHLGPTSLKAAHRPYNDSVVTTLNEQFLLNLVRLKYRDNPYFIEISSITSQQKLEGSVGSGSSLNALTKQFASFSPSASVDYSETPTITYSPLQGEDFLNKLMAPIPLSALLITTQSGWSFSRVCRVAVEQANSVKNAPSASGPTPSRVPEFADFKAMAEDIRRLQEDGDVKLFISGEHVYMGIGSNRSNSDEQIKEILGVSPRVNAFRLTSTPERNQKADTVYLQPRSIMGVLFYLSQNVEVPGRDIGKGLVTVTKDKNGNVFNWDQVSGDLLKVKSAATPPANAFVKIKYRGSWFYIPDNDLESKSTFMLLNQLFNLQAGDANALAPSLTIPLG